MGSLRLQSLGIPISIIDLIAILVHRLHILLIHSSKDSP